jgi:hypothetical protein
MNGILYLKWCITCEMVTRGYVLIDVLKILKILPCICERSEVPR